MEVSVLILMRCVTLVSWCAAVGACVSARRRRPSLLGQLSGFISLAVCCGVASLRCQEYCGPRMNYAEVRRNVEYALAEKVNELHDWLALVQSLSKESLQILEKLDTHCGAALRHAEGELGHNDPSARQAP